MRIDSVFVFVISSFPHSYHLSIRVNPFRYVPKVFADRFRFRIRNILVSSFLFIVKYYYLLFIIRLA
nr:MAG TPA: hypothetical protein [Caudoviricetes sp.]